MRTVLWTALIALAMGATVMLTMMWANFCSWVTTGSLWGLLLFLTPPILGSSFYVARLSLRDGTLR